MVDIFALALSHALILLALWRMVGRDDLDGEPPAAPPATAGADDQKGPPRA